MVETTSRYGLPLLVAGQGQKDLTHNEAIEAMDALLQPLLLGRAPTSPPASNVAGDAWLIPANAEGEWGGKSGVVAVWTSGGWRYRAPAERFTAWLKSENRRIRKTATGWRDEAPFEGGRVAIAEPSGGTMIDVEARSILALLLAQLAEVGLINRQD